MLMPNHKKTNTTANIFVLVIIFALLQFVFLSLIGGENLTEKLETSPARLQVIQEDDESEKTAANCNFSLVAAGDVMLDRGVGKKIAKLGVDFPFEHVDYIFRNADIAFANLESPASCLGTQVKGKEVTFRAALNAINSLRNVGIDVVSLANNHAMDYGQDALAETMDVLSHNRITYVGAGANSMAAHRPSEILINGLKVSFLAYTYKFHKVVEAQIDQPGVAIAHNELVKSDIKKAKEWADIVVVSFHWGWEYSDHPDKETRELAHLAVESGADLVVGHHPHVIQGVEVYEGGLICYSLGNFIFDQRGNRTRRGLILRCSMDKLGVKRAEILPVIIHPSEFRPYPASGEAAKTILLELSKLSKQLKTEIDLRENIAVILRKEAMLVGTERDTKRAY